MRTLELLSLVAALFTGAAGWGEFLVRVCKRAGWQHAQSDIELPLRVAIGMSASLAVGGVCIALEVARFWCLFSWQLAGCVLALWYVAHRKARRWGRTGLVTGAATAVMGGLFTLLGLGNAFSGVYSQGDDLLAYAYLARRLESTGGMIDPFNFRRITSYGGSTLYQSLFLRVSGPGSLRAFELVFAALLVIAMTVGITRRRWFVPGTLALGLGVLILHVLTTGPYLWQPPLQIVNLSPAYSATALTLAVFLLISKIPDVGRRAQPALLGLIGLCLAGLLALRFTFLPATFVALFLALAARRNRRAIALGALSLGVCILGSVGWAVASLRSSGTPMFSLLAGNYNVRYGPARDPRVNTIGDYAHRFLSEFNFDHVGYVPIACLVVAALMWRRLLRGREHAVALSAAALGCLVQLVILTIAFPSAEIGNVVRLESPTTLACALFAISLIWPRRPEAPERAGDVAGPAPEWHRLAVRHGRTALLVLSALSLGTLAFGYSISDKFTVLRSELRTGANVIGGSAGFTDPYSPATHAAYRELNALIPRGARVLSAVNDPALLDVSKFQFATLDFPGAVSPPPHLPLFKGTAAVLHYLRRLGYDFLAVDLTGIYGPNLQRVFLVSTIWTNREVGVYLRQWRTVVDGLERKSGLRALHASELTLIDLR